jgi:hypothetical protein
MFGNTIRAADQFDKHINIIAPRQGGGVVFPSVVLQIHPTIKAAIARADGGDFKALPGAGGQKIGVVLDDFNHPGSNGPKACNPKAEGACHIGIPIWHIKLRPVITP